jgi:glycerol-3-phosphate dehydrogenase (NAD(P)+)
MNLRVSVLGAGSFGTTMAHLFTQNAPTLLWCRRFEIAEEINQEHRNESYLPGHSIAEDVRATASIFRSPRKSMACSTRVIRPKMPTAA